MTAKVIVHPHPDLDACVCIALSGAATQDVHFVPAGATELPAVCPCCAGKLTGTERVLDHPLGEKGRLDADGTRHAAACSMPEAPSADPDLLGEVEEQDSTGRVLQPRFSLARILVGIRAELSETGLRGSALDRGVVEAMGLVIRGINRMHQRRGPAAQIAARARIETIGAFRVAILPLGEISPEVGIVLNQEHDVSCAIFAQGNNLGVTRYPGRDIPDLRLLTPHLPGWFIHTAGFLACWGSRKSPAMGPAPAGTPRSQDELLALLRRVFG